MIRLVLMAALLSGNAWGSEGLKISDAWIREAPPGAAVMAGYATLTNAGDKPVIVCGAQGVDFGAIELHKTVVEDGRMRMLTAQRLELAPGKSAKLEPGGLHLMLFKARRALKAGDRSSLKLGCGDSGTVAEFQVRAD
jgi:hypothetical protein